MEIPAESVNLKVFYVRSLLYLSVVKTLYRTDLENRFSMRFWTCVEMADGFRLPCSSFFHLFSQRLPGGLDGAELYHVVRER